MSSVISGSMNNGALWRRASIKLATTRPQMTVEGVAIVAAGFFTLFCNATFFREIAGVGALSGASGWRTGLSLIVAIAALHMVLLCLMLNRWTAKPLLTLLLLVTAAASHFMEEYTVYLNPGMLRNIFHTDEKESRELMTSGMLSSVLVLGVLPSAILWWIRIQHRPLKRALLVRIVALTLAASVVAIALLGSFQSLSSLMRNHKEVRHLVTPANYLVSLARVLHSAHTDRGRSREPVGVNAQVIARPAGEKPRLLVLVVGETLRAQNWGLNGYERETTPQLAQTGAINFPDVTACGSDTGVSVPCMFSHYGRANYDKDKIKHSESLLQVLERAGVGTIWLDNQTGCKGVCDGLAFESFRHAKTPDLCTAEGCLDEVLLRRLPDVIRYRSSDVVVVLHQLGNHGPAYYKRYPPSFRRFAPTCETADFGRCSREEIINAYDNAILYTDHFLSGVIGQLNAQSTHEAALIYVSDHGESLGENGLYLHGVPYAIAPDEQLRVPMVMWFSPGFIASTGIDTVCLGDRSASPVSHDNLFHTVLGLMGVTASEMDPKLNLLEGCGSP
ncbi:phosphoethanolamine transferase [Pseudoxanthomonas sp. UTMC 1351]|uniref:phosphoethanolamine transferase n=1 Tax=Pseudoxanthomonas sp. UTMC 1351 TaxID=2695853 RepID=UPI0034CE9735